MFNKIEKKIDAISESAKDHMNDLNNSDTKNIQKVTDDIANKGAGAVSDLKETLTSKVESNPVGATFAGAFIGLIIGIFISKK